MILAGLVLVTCPLLIGLALAVAPSSQEPAQLALDALGLSGCFALLLVLPGVALVFAGRARH
jgi:hypothetical protein